jgi:hypothetical protein
MAYDPTAAGDPAFNSSTNTAKCYANYPKNVSGGTTGHRTTQFLGRNLQVATDDSVAAVTHPYGYALKHPQ